MKLLKSLVIGMGILIVLGMGLLAWGVYQKTGGRAETAKGAGMGAGLSAPPAFGYIPFDPGPGCAIAGIEPIGAGLWLRIEGEGPACQKAVLINLETGKVVGTVGGRP
ncbi:MAG: hypothetical protein ACYYKD_11520 [Rhodospirillales bacterium]